MLPLDLHVLSLSLAFILSQDQTLRCINCFVLLRIRYLFSSFDGINSLILVLLVDMQIFQRTFAFFSIAAAKVKTFFKPPNFFRRKFEKFFLSLCGGWNFA